MAIRLVIFDLDGTLVDSIGDITSALNYTFLPYGARPMSSREVAAMVGEGAFSLVKRVIEAHGLALDPEALTRRYIERYRSHLTDRTFLYPGAEKTLDALKGYKSALVSNKSEALTRRVLDAFGLRGRFHMVTGEDTVSERKPSPAPILHVLAALEVEPHEAVMVGDSPIDVTAGKAASIRTVAITHGYGKPGFEHHADFVIKSLLELPGLLRNLDRGLPVSPSYEQCGSPGGAPSEP